MARSHKVPLPAVLLFVVAVPIAFVGCPSPKPTITWSASDTQNCRGSATDGTGVHETYDIPCGGGGTARVGPARAESIFSPRFRVQNQHVAKLGTPVSALIEGSASDVKTEITNTLQVRDAPSGGLSVEIAPELHVNLLLDGDGKGNYSVGVGLVQLKPQPTPPEQLYLKRCELEYSRKENGQQQWIHVRDMSFAKTCGGDRDLPVRVPVGSGPIQDNHIPKYIANTWRRTLKLPDGHYRYTIHLTSEFRAMDGEVISDATLDAPLTQR